MNVTAKHGQAAVHLASHEINNAGHYASACGISATANSRFTVRGYKNVQKLRPTDKAVTCKRCLKKIEKTDKCGASRYGTGDKFNLCTRTPEHTGNHRTAEGNEFTNWTDPEEKMTGFTSKPPAPVIDEHAAAVAQMRANIDAEEEKRAAARRARNRSNYKRTEKTGIESLRDMLTLY